MDLPFLVCRLVPFPTSCVLDLWLDMSTHYISTCFCRRLGLIWSHQLHLTLESWLNGFCFFSWGLHPSLYLLQNLNDFSQLGLHVFWADLSCGVETHLWRGKGDLACVTEWKWIGRTMVVWGTRWIKLWPMTYLILGTYYSISIIHSWNKHSISQHSIAVFFS